MWLSVFVCVPVLVVLSHVQCTKHKAQSKQTHRAQLIITHSVSIGRQASEQEGCVAHTGQCVYVLVLWVCCFIRWETE